MSPTVATHVVAKSGDGQTAPAGGLLPAPLQVSLLNASDVGVQGATVRFKVTRGATTGTVVTDTIAVGGLDGVASMQVRLGTTLDTSIVLAFLAGREAQGVSFTLVATAPPHLDAVAPTSVAANDTVRLRGSKLATTADDNIVFFGSARARVIRALADTALDVVVPPCITPGAVAARVQVGSVLTNFITVTYGGSTRAVSLAALQGTTVSGADLTSCLRLAAGARYLIVPQSAAVGTGSEHLDFQLTATSPAAFVPPAGVIASAARIVEGTPPSAQQQFDAFLRAREGELARATRGTRPPQEPAAAAAFPPPAPALGSQRTFRVLGTLSGTNFKTVTARLRYAGAHILVYVDVDQLNGAFTDAELAAMGKLFDETMYAIDVQAFGAESDVDRNGRVDVLLSPAVNALTTAADCRTSGFITGFFFGLDLLLGQTNSNNAEVFYSLVPDPDAVRSCAHSKDAVARIIPATFIHEFQHMISFGQHVLARDGDVEVLWLNEGLSHIAEELGGRYYEDRFPPPSGRTDPAQLFPDSAQGFTVPDLQNAQRFLTAPSQSSVIATSGSATLEERGAAWLFLRWLGDVEGEAIYTRLVQTGITGVRNIETQVGESFPSLFGDFSTALYTDSLPGVARSAIPKRDRFVHRNLRQIFKRFADTDTSHQTAPFPIPDRLLVPGVPATGQLTLGSMDFWVLDARALPVDLTLRFAHANQTPFAVTDVAQLGIFRLP